MPQTIHIYAGDPDEFSYPIGRTQSDRDLAKTKGIRRMPDWTPVSVIMSDELEEGANRPVADLSAIVLGTPAFSRRALAAMMPLIHDSVEVLPLSLEEFSIINVLDVIDCLDMERSKLAMNKSGGFVSNIYHYEVRREMLKDKHIFKIPQVVDWKVYVSDTFKRIAEVNNLIGADFPLLP